MRGAPFASGVGATVILHAGAALAILLGHRHAEPPPDAPQLMVARLVRLGQPRPPHLLPRKPAAPPPAPAPAPAIEPAPQPESKAPRREPTPAEPTDLRDAMARARALADQADELSEPEGRPEGVPEGTAADAAEGDPYATEVWRRIREGWRVPAMVPDRQLPRLRALVFLRLADDGRIVEYRVVESSGNRFFDASAREAVQLAQRLPPPPPDRARAILAHGILLEFSGLEAH